MEFRFPGRRPPLGSEVSPGAFIAGQGLHAAADRRRGIFRLVTDGAGQQLALFQHDIKKDIHRIKEAAFILIWGVGICVKRRGARHGGDGAKHRYLGEGFF
jgi:hypothetical protein